MKTEMLFWRPREPIGMVKGRLRLTRPGGAVVEKVFDKPINFWTGLALLSADKPPKS